MGKESSVSNNVATFMKQRGQFAAFHLANLMSRMRAHPSGSSKQQQQSSNCNMMCSVKGTKRVTNNKSEITKAQSGSEPAQRNVRVLSTVSKHAL